MSGLKFSIYLISLCFGSFGVVAGFYPEFILELFMGMILPLTVGLITILSITSIHGKSPEKVNSFMVKSFLGKMVLYGVFFVIIFTFFAFNSSPFILSFVVYFITLHICEALFLKTLFTKKNN